MGLTAEDVKAALRRRHPAFEPGSTAMRWTCIEEWQNIDLLALEAWQSAEVVGYEVKVSRSDLHSELMDPTKRSAGVAMCTRFYFAVPAGLLKPEEREWEEPDWEDGDFKRDRCTNPACNLRHAPRGWMRDRPKPRGPILKGTEREGVSIHLGFMVDRSDPGEVPSYTHHLELTACCNVCKGRGTVAKSKAELLAPYVWVPRDVGLVVVGPRGCSVLKEAPRNKTPEPILPWPFVAGRNSRLDEENSNRVTRHSINQLARWVSYRPDPRHAARRDT